MIEERRKPAEWSPDWERIAHRIVIDSLQLQPRERVVYLADPYVEPRLLDEVRAAVLDAGGIEQATILNWTPRLRSLRGEGGVAREEAAILQERHAHLDLFNTADVFIWLPWDQFRPGSFTALESEWILGRWRGRSVHFHLFVDERTPKDDPIQAQVQQTIHRAILDLDYEALRERQDRLVAAIRGRRLRVTTPDGTDVSFVLPRDGWYHCNDGDASREKAVHAVCARDREEELPCGAVRSLPAPDSVDGVIRLRRPASWNGWGFDINRFSSHLDITFTGGHISEMRGGDRDGELQELRTHFEGDWDRLGEVVFGTNPLLPTVEGARMPTYWGFGEGWFRFHIGESWESGGPFDSNILVNLFLGDTTIEAEGTTIIDSGRLLL